MKVEKRDGRLEELNILNIRKQTIPACEGLEGCSYEDLELKSKILFIDGIKTTDIQSALIKTAAQLIDIDAPNWTYVAARLSLYDLYHNIKRIYGVEGSGNVYDKVTLKMYIDRNKKLFSNWYSKYTDEEIDELNSVIDSDLDKLITFPSFLALANRYLLIDVDTVVELPQHMYMGMAMFTAQNEKDKVKWAKEFYNKLSTLKMIAGTPIVSNGRLKNGATASCLITSIDDNIDSIFDSYKEIALGSRKGAGWGVDVTRLRATSSPIGGIDNRAGGPIPFIKVINDISLAVNQGGKMLAA